MGMQQPPMGPPMGMQPPMQPPMGMQQPPMDVEGQVATLIVQYTKEVMTALMPPMEGQVDPLVQLRSKELDIKATDIQRKSEEFAVKQDFQEQKEGERQGLVREKMDSQEDIALLRAEVSRERMEQQDRRT
mgnify:FL=1